MKHQVDELRIADLSSAALNDANLSGANLARARLDKVRRARTRSRSSSRALKSGIRRARRSGSFAQNSPSGAAGRG